MKDLTKALLSLYSDAQWQLDGDDYAGLRWLSADVQKPTEQELLTECERLQAEYDNKEYQRQRATKYPPMTDYLDAVVKGDQAAIDAYIAACLAVKAKYPKETT